MTYSGKDGFKLILVSLGADGQPGGTDKDKDAIL
ncbi:MAG: type II secretion system protein GspG [Acidobacteria bacterium]|nr:type II secretion system protein GspG [Acidobacteriota bacterium]